jgi:pectate lyase
MKHSLLILLTLTLSASACTTSADTGALTTPAPSVTLTTETVSGTVPVGGSDIHNVVLSQAGELDITLTAAGPPSTIFMGLGIGTLSGSTCVFLSGGTTNVQAGTTPQLSGSSMAAGPYCVEVYDIGNEASPVTYALTVVHP